MGNWTVDSAPLLGKERKPNACEPCGAFKKIDDEYHPPTTHFWSCRHFIDQGVLRVNSEPQRQQVPNGVRRVR